MKKILFTSIMIGAFVIAAAMPGNGKVFTDTYKLKSSSTLAKAACGACHASSKGGVLNPYGVSIQAEMKKAKTKKMTAAILRKVDALDSDKDGCVNLCEITKGRKPGVKDAPK